MELLNLTQGTDEWLEARLNHLTASEAPAMMGESKFMTRNQLLDLKKGWLTAPDSSFKQRLYQKGHEHEEAARELIEFDFCEEYPAAVGKTVIEGLELLASFDGYSESAGIWEHKDWNKTLAENVMNNILEPLYYWQLEHQILVAEKDSVMFTISDGTADNRKTMTYYSEPERRKALIAGWKQFLSDLESHQLKAKIEVVEANTKQLPVIQVSVQGSEITTNIQSCLIDIKSLAQEEMSKALESDQDFANKEQLNKDVKKARASLKIAIADVEGQFVSYAEFASVAKEMDSTLQKMQSHGEKQVKQAKEAKKQSIIDHANSELFKHIEACDLRITPMSIGQIIGGIAPDWQSAMKNKRTIDSLTNSVDEVLTKVKVEINQIMDRVLPNLDYLKNNAADHRFLFNDAQQLVSLEEEGFQAIVKSRIAEHKAAEEKRLAEERERIRQEEERKAQAEAERKAEAERQRIAQEEREKLQAEQRKLQEQADADFRKRMDEESVRPEDIKWSAPEVKPADPLRSDVQISVEPSENETAYVCLDLWPSDITRANNDELNEVCEKLDEAEEHIGRLAVRLHQMEQEQKSLQRRSFKLQCLEDAGVDNWSGGWDIAMEAYYSEYPIE